MVLYRYLITLWLNPLLFFKWLKSMYWYIRWYIQLKNTITNKRFSLRMNYPCLHDKDDNSGTANGHYYHQDLLISQKIYEANPERHIDIWSRIDGFVAHVASFREIEVFDIRDLQSNSKNLTFRQLDLMWDIPAKYIECTDSLSCLHTIEHFGLGRYGDKIDYDGHIKWFQQMSKIVKKWWTFYFSTPIWKNQRIEFNAHRIFSLNYLINDLFKNTFNVVSFSYVDDKGDLHQNIILNEKNIQSVFNLDYGCGIFVLRKL